MDKGYKAQNKYSVHLQVSKMCIRSMQQNLLMFNYIYSFSSKTALSDQISTSNIAKEHFCMWNYSK